MASEGEVDPVASPDQFKKTYLVPVPPETIRSASVPKALVPESYQPSPDGVSWAEVTVRKYWVFQLATASLGAFIKMASEGEVLPVASPDQFKKTYLIPVPPETIRSASVPKALSPESYQPSPDGVSWAEVTVR